jgi:ABC-2 type transport system ATP-binding protein
MPSPLGAAEAAVHVEGLVKRYGAKTAVDGLDLQVARGSVTAVLGPNGAGKTTTVECCEGYRRPDAGTVRVLGLDPVRDSARLRPRVGVMLQSGGIPQAVRAVEMLRHVARLHADPLPVDLLVDRLGLGSAGNTPYRRLSGGQQQRLSLALAVVGRPEVVFLDEPTAALDPQARRNLWDLLSGLNDSGRTVVLTTHYMEEAEALCDRVAIMDHGKILELDSPTMLVRRLDAATRITVLPEQLAREDAERIGGLESVEESVDGLVLSTRAPAAVLTELAARDALGGITVQSGTLEDVFLATTGREYRA